MSGTPILDLHQPPPVAPKTMVRSLIGLAIGAALGLILASGKLPDWNWPRANGLLLIPALYFAIALHELGHLIAGKLAGFNIGGISVGPVMFTKSGRHWVFRFDRHRLFGGFFQPLSSDVDLPTNRYVLCVAGGPIASVAFTLSSWLVCTRYGSGERDWIGGMFWASLLIVLQAVIPVTAGLNKSDSARLWQLYHRPERSLGWIALLAIQSEDAKGLRPRDWSPETFQRLLLVDARLPASFSVANTGRITDSWMRARKPWRWATWKMRSRNRVELELYGGMRYFWKPSASAMIRKQAAQARTWCERACKLKKPLSLEVVNAGIAMCEGRYPDAVQHWEAAREYVTRRRLDLGMIRFAKEKWAEFEAVSRAAQL